MSESIDILDHKTFVQRLLSELTNALNGKDSNLKESSVLNMATLAGEHTWKRVKLEVDREIADSQAKLAEEKLKIDREAAANQEKLAEANQIIAGLCEEILEKKKNETTTT